MFDSHYGRRHDERLPGAFPVEFVIEGRRYTGVAVDLSPSGLRLRTNSEVSVGDHLCLTVSGPEGARADVEGIAKWVVEFPHFINPIFSFEIGLLIPNPSPSFQALFNREIERFLDWRDAPRVTNVVRVEICAPGLWEATFALNVSRKGLFVRTDRDLQPGQLVEVRLLLPKENEFLALCMEVVHVLDKSRAAKVGTPPGAGLRLASVSPEQRRRYYDFCNFLETRLLSQ